TLLVLLGDELLNVDVEADVLPERDGGRGARLDLGRLELGRILELAGRRFGDGGLRAAGSGLGRRAPGAKQWRGGCRSETELEQFSAGHPAHRVRLTAICVVAHSGLSFRRETT